MVNVVLISDRGSHAWYNWLSNELLKRNHSFFIPPLPKSEEGVDSWVLALKDFRKYLGEDSVIVAHGAGRVIALKILEEKLRKIAGVVFISGVPLVDVFSNFSFDELDFSIIKNKADNFFVYASEVDLPSSLKESEVLADNLDDEVLILDGPKYFQDFDKFEDLLIDILSMCD